MAREYSTLLDLVGATPIVRLQNVGAELAPTLLAKLEYLNPGGSNKDRIALSMIGRAEQDGRLLGLVHYLFHRATAMVEDTCYLADLFTNQKARGKGVGRRLIEAVYEAARAAGSSRVYWQTHESNATAQRLYDRVAERSGFIVYRKLL